VIHMNGSYVPFSAAHDRFFSVSFVESSRSDRDCHEAAKCPLLPLGIKKRSAPHDPKETLDEIFRAAENVTSSRC